MANHSTELSIRQKPKPEKSKDGLSIINPHGCVLKVLNPEQYTLEDLKWINDRHSKTNPAVPLKVVRDETIVPEDLQTIVVNRGYYQVWLDTQGKSGWEPPQWFKDDYSVRQAAVCREKAKWQPLQREAEKRKM